MHSLEVAVSGDEFLLLRFSLFRSEGELLEDAETKISEINFKFSQHLKQTEMEIVTVEIP